MLDVAIVDYDCLSPTGCNIEDAWATMSTNGSGVSNITRYDPRSTPLLGLEMVSYGAQLPLSLAELAGGGEHLEKWAEPGFHAVRVLCRRILKRLDFEIRKHDSQRIAFLGGTTLTSQYSKDLLARTQKPDSKYILNQCHNIPLAVAAGEFGIQGPCFSVGSACSSSAQAVLLAAQFITGGLADAAFVVGFDFPIMPSSVGGLDWVNALYRRDLETDRGFHEPSKASRPFSKDRRGFVLGEAAGAVLLSRTDYARKLDWPVRGFIRGGYSNSDAGHLTRPSLSNVVRCIHGALENAGCAKEEIQCINAHATSTPIGDAVELNGLYQVFGPRLRQIPIVANKSQIGHSLGAAAIMGLIFAVHGMHKQTALPTLNYIPDPELPEALAPPSAMTHPHQVTLLNSFGFGGTNVCLIAAGPS